MLVSLFRITRAPITPGTHPMQVRIVTIKNEPQPLSTIASGGKMIDNITLNSDIVLLLIYKINSVIDHSLINLQILCQSVDWSLKSAITNIFSFIN